MGRNYGWTAQRARELNTYLPATVATTGTCNQTAAGLATVNLMRSWWSQEEKRKKKLQQTLERRQKTMSQRKWARADRQRVPCDFNDLIRVQVH
jgi:hypothetical protein